MLAARCSEQVSARQSCLQVTCACGEQRALALATFNRATVPPLIHWYFFYLSIPWCAVGKTKRSAGSLVLIGLVSAASSVPFVELLARARAVMAFRWSLTLVCAACAISVAWGETSLLVTGSSFPFVFLRAKYACICDFQLASAATWRMDGSAINNHATAISSRKYGTHRGPRPASGA